MQVWNLLHAARWKCRTQKSRKNLHLGTIAQLCWAISSQLRHVSTIEKNLLSSDISSTCPHNMVNFGLPNIGGALSAQRRKVWLTPNTRVPCSKAAKTRNPLKFEGVPQTTGSISAASLPKFTILRGHMGEILVLNKCFSDCWYVP